MGADNHEVVEALRTTLKERDRLRRENLRLQAGANEPIAIVGMACRYPGGADSPERLWELVAEGRDAIGEFPADRGWDIERIYDPDPEHPGTSYTREGGFLPDVAEFDPDFFSISPREALVMDPQERLLLESCWEALEDAGIDPAGLRRSQTGVFAGVAQQDYGSSAVLSSSVVSGRVSYTLGLEGPAITVNTACSSSLVAIHLAAGALRGGECALALAGGVTVLAAAGTFVVFSTQGALAPDGRSKSFAEAADGTGWSEGAGVLVLERLSDAQRNGHPVHAVIRGSAVNQDGASNGLTAPNGPSQERVIRQALANARLEPRDIDAVEAHGTGTTLGDPIEAGALLATYGQDRETPLRLGSIKSNIGHTQAAAGVGGVIKMAQAMRHGVLPKTLHVDTPSSKIEWEAGAIELLTEPVDWEANGRPRRAGVSSFGISGTNAHVILEQPPEPAAAGVGGDGDTSEEGEAQDGGEAKSLPAPILFALSAKSEPALAEAASRLQAHLQESPELDPTDVAYSLATTRTAFEHRAVALGESREQLLEGLRALADGSASERIARGRAGETRDPVFLYPGQGSQWQGMALDLIEASPVFEQTLTRCEEALAPHIEWSVRETIEGTEGAPSLERIEVVQPALFAVMASLTELWRSVGVRPAAVAGHSQGEIAAAHAAGGLSLEDAALLAARRSQIISRLAGKGGMASVALSATELEGRISKWEGQIEIAALNSPAQTILSGSRDALDELLAQCEQEEIRAREIPAAIASHSAYVEELREEVLETLAPISPQSGQIPFHSTVTGGVLDTASLDASYWYRNLREQVRLQAVTEGLLEQGHRAFVEISPHPVFALALGETIEAALEDPSQATVLGTLRREEHGPTRFALSLAEAHAGGAKVDWRAHFAGTGARAVSLPTYPFQRRRFWLDSAPVAAGDPSAAGLSPAGHPLLGAAVELAGGDGEALLLTGRISLATHPWLADHAVAGTVLLPGTAFLELALKAGAETVEELAMLSPLILPEHGAVDLQVSVDAPDADGRRELAIHSRQGEEEEWSHNAEGALSGREIAAGEPLDQWPPAGAEPLELDGLYERLEGIGVEYGPAFKGLVAAWRDGERIYAEVRLPEEAAHDAGAFAIHPALFDAVLQATLPAKLEASADGFQLPFSWREVDLRAAGGVAMRACLSENGEGLSLHLADDAGAPLASVGSIVSRPLDPAKLAGAGQGRGDLLSLEWAPAALAEQDGPPADVELLRCEAPGEGAEAAAGATREALAAVQGWLAADEHAGSRLALLTRGAVATAPDATADPVAAAIWGLVRSAQSEHPGRFALIDSDGSEASEAALDAALALSAAEPQLALREGEALVPRLARLSSDGEVEAAPRIDPGRTVLITGGAGGLGALVARHLAERYGAGHLLLCDSTERADLHRALDRIPADRPLGAVVHCAGALADGTIEAMEPEQVERVFAPKADAAWALHELTAGMDLTAFVLFSSVAGVLGGPGQANYAAANVFLDALAQRRRAEGLPATSIGWGLREQQLTTPELDEASVARIRRGGMEALSDEAALGLFDAALACDRAAPLALRLNPGALRVLASSAALPPIFSGLVRVPRRRSAAAGSLAQKLATVAEGERQALVLDLVRGEVAAVLGHDSPAQVEPARAFRDLGFDSLTAVELRNRLSLTTGLRLPATVVFDYPSAAALAEHLLAEATASGAAKQVAVRAQASEEPIAIVGMACRYPGGADSPERLWELVAEGRDAIGEFPADRGWDIERIYDPDPEHPGTSYTREGGFVADVAEFDPDFFSISPREALIMDPQERLLLESCWEALEDAGIDPASLRRSQTGVFAGVAHQDYGPSSVLTSSTVSGRVSYTLGLEGPAITVNTACSSSLVAMHLASQALRGGECGLALAGGVSIHATPEIFLEFSRQRGAAPDGRCKSFAEAADGAGFADGAGVLVLERLSDARRKGHPVHAVLCGSAVNQDGASNGFAAPNGPSQERVIRQALANARLEPKDIDAVEAHGTGTTLGDPIEAGALLATYGQDREMPLKLGSLKSNIGHTQAAAGVGGVIKMAQAMRHGVLPKTLHVDAPSSKIEWEAGAVELLAEPLQWEPNGRPRRAGISSFGVSGTNAHLILEEAPVPPEREAGSEGTAPAGSQSSPGPISLPLSARSEDGLARVAGRLESHLRERPELDPRDVAFSLATTRSTFEHRATVVGSDRDELLAAVGALAASEDSEAVVRGRAREDSPPVFLFPGQGAQYAGMATGLLATSPVFTAKIDACETALAEHVEWSLIEVLTGTDASWLDRLDIVQPALFAVMVSLAELWSAAGVAPAAVLGHSQGEIAAAHVAGVLSLEDAARVVARRAQAMTKLAGKGGMLSVSLGPEQLSPYAEAFGERVSLAAVNGPASSVLSGEPDALAEVRAACEADGVRTQKIAVDYAAHSSQIEALREELLEAFGPISPQAARVPLHSTVTGERIDGAEMGAGYWYRNLRETVLLEPVLRSLLGAGRRNFIEVSPHPVLAFGVQETIEAALADTSEATLLSTLRREEDAPTRFALAVGQAHVEGVSVAWEAYLGGGRRVPLPTYPFDRRRFWLDAKIAGPGDAAASGQAAAEHPVLGAAVDVAGDGGALLLTGRLSLATHPWLADHAVAGRTLVPGAVFLELALRAAGEVGAETVAELSVLAPLTLVGAEAVDVQVAVAAPSEDGRRGISIHSRPAGERGAWTAHAAGFLAEESPALEARPPEIWPPEGAASLDLERLYDLLGEAGLEYGPGFRRLDAAWEAGGEVYAEVSLGEEHLYDARRFSMHPVLLDAAQQPWIQLDDGAGPTGARMLAAWRDVRVREAPPPRLRLRLTRERDGASLVAFDEGGDVAVSIAGLRARDLGSELAGEMRRRCLHRVEWHEVDPVPDGVADAQIAILGQSGLEGVSGARYGSLGELTAAIDGGLAVPEIVLAQAGATIEALTLLREWLVEDGLSGSRLALLTETAVEVVAGDEPQLDVAALPGLLRSASAEHPGRFAVLDLDRAEESRAALAAAVGLAAVEPELALRGGRLLAPRLERASLGEETTLLDGAGDAAPEAALVVGAADGIAGALADGLRARHGARRVVVAGPEEIAAGTTLEALLGPALDEPRSGTVIFAPEPLGESSLATLSPASLERELDFRAEIAQALHEQTASRWPARLALLSSLTGAIGGPGQAAAGAAATAFDALAAHRRAAGLPAVSLTCDGSLAPDGVAELLDAAAVADSAAMAGLGAGRAELRAALRAGALPALLRDAVGRGAGAPPGSSRRELAGLPAGERERRAVELVRELIATVLGHSAGAAVDPDRAFVELGVDSLGAMELRKRLDAAIGVQVPLSVLSNQPSVREIGAWAAARLDPAAVADVGERPPTGTFTGLLEGARAQDRLDEVMELIEAAARFRPQFDEPAGVAEARVAELADGSRGPSLILSPSLVAVGGPHEYVRLSKPFTGDRRVLSASHPGFAEGQPLPATVEAFARAVAEPILRVDGGLGLVLAGYSSGGWAALALAAQLEQLGTAPAGVILIDTPATSVNTAKLLELMPALDADPADRLVVQPDDARLTAMAAYFGLFRGWAPAELSAPVCAVRAEEPMAEVDRQIDRLEELVSPRETVHVPGNHFTMMWEHSATTARAVWGLIDSMTNLNNRKGEGDDRASSG